jgi:hypothetical protein
MRKIRLALILLIGTLLIRFTYEIKYKTIFFEEIIFGGLRTIGLLLILWALVKDIQLFKKEKKAGNFSLTFLALLFAICIFILQLKIAQNFNKPTLIRVYYDGDYNGTGIDFKTDGTYIFDNSAIGQSDYFYGVYQITGNRITMDKDNIDNLAHFKFLEIQDQQSGDIATDLYLYQTDSLGNSIESAQKYIVVIDNRMR